jgi:glucose/arabinose dehydrogenase
VTLPPGFQIHYYAQNVPNARSMALGANGTLFVGSRSAGSVYAVVDPSDDRQADQVITIARGLNSPNGVAFRDNALYVAEIHRIIRFDNIEASLDNPPTPVVVNQEYPSDTWHGWKYLRFGPDGYLYAPVGAPCNVCEPGDGLYGTITRLRRPLGPDGSGLEVYARGIRNTVGFDWDPLTQELWFTDNGHDELGDDIPPDELNHAPQAGLHFGFPYCHGVAIADPQFGQQQSCAEFTAPAMALGPHVAALGMRFYTGAMFPPEYQNQIFIAEHGSASRSTPIGYRITLVRLVDGQAASYETFAEGWLQNGQVLGRPVDLLVLPDGSLLVSDDTANAIYRIHYQTPS